MSLDYKKWDNLEASDSDEDECYDRGIIKKISPASSPSTPDVAVSSSLRKHLEDWYRFKAKTDAIMLQENYEVAMRGYAEILSMILMMLGNGPERNTLLAQDADLQEVTQLIISCRLGGACCLLKMSCYEEALPHIERALDEPLSNSQRVRALFFKIAALSKADSMEKLESAKEIGQELMQSIAMDPSSTEKSQVLEYTSLIDDIESKILLLRTKQDETRSFNILWKACTILKLDCTSESLSQLALSQRALLLMRAGQVAGEDTTSPRLSFRLYYRHPY